MRHIPLLVPLAVAFLLSHPASSVGTCRTGRTACLSLPNEPTPICSPVMIIPTAWTHCTADTDCELVSWACCGCGGAGLSIAINTSFAANHAKRYARFCPDYVRPVDDPQLMRCPQWDLCPVQATLSSVTPSIDASSGSSKADEGTATVNAIRLDRGAL